MAKKKVTRESLRVGQSVSIVYRDGANSKKWYLSQHFAIINLTIKQHKFNLKEISEGDENMIYLYSKKKAKRKMKMLNERLR